MDISQDPNKKKKGSELDSERSSQDSLISDSRNADPLDTIEIDGQVIRVADDLKGLPEFDYDDPENKKWIEEEDAAFRRRHPHLTYEEATRNIEKRLAELAKSDAK